MKCRFGGLNIHTDNPEAVLEFYRKLGFRVLQEPTEPYFGAMLALELAIGQTPVIWIWKRGKEDRECCCNHFVFLTDGHPNEVYQQILLAGIPCDPPSKAEWGGQEMILHDPAGNSILFL